MRKTGGTSEYHAAYLIANYIFNDFFYLHSGGGGGIPSWVPSARRPVPAPGDDDGEIGGMKVGRGNRSTRRKPAPAPLCPPQIPLDQTRAAAVGSQRLTA
jgi:hypothetical protein